MRRKKGIVGGGGVIREGLFDFFFLINVLSFKIRKEEEEEDGNTLHAFPTTDKNNLPAAVPELRQV